MEIRVAEPHGMCSGVARALKIADEAIAAHPGETLWCFHEIVHNAHVVEGLKARGAVFVQEIEAIPEGSRVLFSAHGVSPAVREAAAARRLEVIDATCPFVTKVHREARGFDHDGIPLLLIGHKGHDEVVGVVGEAPGRITVIASAADVATLPYPADTIVAVLSQTTVSQELYATLLKAVRARGYKVLLPPKHGICYATQERQNAVRALAAEADRMLVIGSRTSSNSKRLVEVAESAGCPAALIESPEDVRGIDLTDVSVLGITSGASTPERLLDETIRSLRERTKA